MDLYAVTGASGHFGRYAVQELLRRNVPAFNIVAIVRSRGKTADLAKRGVQIREADYTRPETLGPALAWVNRLLFVSSSDVGNRLVQHVNTITAAKLAGISRIMYTSILNADHTTNPLAAKHQETERALRDGGVPFTLLRNSWCTENYNDQLSKYLKSGEILGSAANGKISAASRQDYASAAAAALLQDAGGSRTYELGGPAFDLSQLAHIISEVTGTRVTYHDLSVKDYADALQRAGFDKATAQLVAAIDASIAHGDLETRRTELANLLGRTATAPAEIVRTAYDASA